MSRKISASRLLHFATIPLVAILVLTTPVAGQQSTTISQGYQTSEDQITVGAIVSLVQNNDNEVEYATPQRVERLIGVVDDDSLIELSTDTKQVQVATNGTALTLVSDINGNVKAGDRITASPAEGVGMKATESGQVIGVAMADLDSVDTQGKTVTDMSGDTQAIKVGRIPLQINIGYYTAPENDKSFLPAFIQELANGVAGREVSAIRVVVALVVLIIGLVTAGALLYAAVRSSIIAIGRNPLSGGSINKGLLQVGLVAVVILAVSFGAVFVVLRV